MPKCCSAFRRCLQEAANNVLQQTGHAMGGYYPGTKETYCRSGFPVPLEQRTLHGLGP